METNSTRPDEYDQELMEKGLKNALLGEKNGSFQLKPSYVLAEIENPTDIPFLSLGVYSDHQINERHAQNRVFKALLDGLSVNLDDGPIVKSMKIGFDSRVEEIVFRTSKPTTDMVIKNSGSGIQTVSLRKAV